MALQQQACQSRERMLPGPLQQRTRHKAAPHKLGGCGAVWHHVPADMGFNDGH
jgi:hypothetical protein